MAGSLYSAHVRQSRGEDLRGMGLPPGSSKIMKKESIDTRILGFYLILQAVHPYVATQPDELSLEVTDVVNVLRKMADGIHKILNFLTIA